MADQKNRGGQKAGHNDPDESQKKQGADTGGTGERADKDKQQDQRNNPDDATRQPTNQK